MTKQAHMAGNFLTEADRKELRARQARERDKRVCDRIKSVLLRDKNWTHQEIAEALLLGEETVRGYVEEYRLYPLL